MVAGMNSHQAGAPRPRPFVAATSTGRRRQSQLLAYLLVVLALLGLSKSVVLAQAPSQGQSGVRPSAFITSTRPAATQAPARGGGPSGQASQAVATQNTASAGRAQQASTASSLAVAASATNSATSTNTPLVPSNSSSAMAPIATEDVTGSADLDTKLDAAFGILGASLVLSGLVLATAGAAYRRLTCFIVTSYAMAVVTMALILHFGIEKQIDPPRSGIRVAFVIAALAAGTIFGLGAAIFHRGAKIVIAPVAGFLSGLVIQCVRNDGLIRPIGPRYLLFLGLAGTAFILGLIPKYFDAVILITTAFLGALAFAIGVDCFTTAGLKEFFVMNLGFTGIFPRLDGHFTISSIMQIELGLIALLFCISIAVQIRFFNLFEKRLARLFAKTEESEKRRQEEEAAAARIGNVMNGDVEKFEHRYSRRFPFAVPNTLPTMPTQAHFDGKSSSPSLPSHTASFNTPKSETAPFLPELNYVTTGSKRISSQPSDQTLAIKPSESSKSFFSQMKTLMQSTSEKEDVPPLPQIPSQQPSGENAETLAKEIAEREQALQKIQSIRQSIDQMRTHLKTQSQDGPASEAASDSNPTPSRPTSPAIVAATKPSLHRQTVSFSGVPEAIPRTSPSTATFTAPRPLSQHSIITTQQHARPAAPPMAAHTRSSSQQTLSRPRPVSTYSNWAAGQVENVGSVGMQSRRQSTMSMDTGRTSLTTGTTGEIQHSQRVFFAEPTRYSTGPQRVVTGIMPARMPQEQDAVTGGAPQRQSMVRTQTMDILDLHAKHKRRLSEIQKTANNAGGEPKSAGMTPSASQPIVKPSEITRKRSSTVTGLSSLQSASLPADTKRQKRSSAMIQGADEFGRRPSPTIKTGISPSATMPAVASSKPLVSPRSTLPTSQAAKPGSSLEAAKDSEAAWLSY